MFRILLGLMALALQAYQLYHEIAQARRSSRLMEHFDNFWNYNDAVWLTLCPTVILLSMPTELPINSGALTTISAFATFSMLIKVMDWMRIFNYTSFYIYLIVQTMRRISPFLLLMIISFFIFGIPMVMLDLNRVNNSETEVIPAVSATFWLPNMLIN